MSAVLDPTINGRPISELKVVELKEELSKRGLSKVGNKNALYDRLKKFLLEDSGENVAVTNISETSSLNDTPSSPPANPLIAEYYAKQEAALREARKDAEAALRSSSGEEASPSPKKAQSRSRRSVANSLEIDEVVVERRTTRSKTRSDTDQELLVSSFAGEVSETQISTGQDFKDLNKESASQENDSGVVSDETEKIEVSKQAGETLGPTYAENEAYELIEQSKNENQMDHLKDEAQDNQLIDDSQVNEPKDENQEEQLKSEGQEKQSVDESPVEHLKEEAQVEHLKEEDEVEHPNDENQSLSETETRIYAKDAEESDEIADSKEKGMSEEPEIVRSEVLVNFEVRDQTVENNGMGEVSCLDSGNQPSIEKESSLSDNVLVGRELPPAEVSQEDARASSSEATNEECEKGFASPLETSQSLAVEMLPLKTEGRISPTKAVLSHSSEKAESGLRLENKRRWKETSFSQDGSDKDVITVPVTEAKDDVEAEKEDLQDSETEETVIPESVSLKKEEISASDDKDEELDYEEPLEHASPMSDTPKPAKQDDDEPVKSMEARGIEASNSSGFGNVLEERLGKKRDIEALNRSEEDEAFFEGMAKRRKVSPARYPESEYLLIRQLTRPFTVTQLKSMLAKHGTLVEKDFWIDGIKSKCIVKYSSKEEAASARESLHNFVWPAGNPKKLKVDFIDEAGFMRFSKPETKEDLKKESTSISSVQPSASLRVSIGNEQRLVSKKSERLGNESEFTHTSSNRERSPRARHESAHGRCSPKKDDKGRSPIDRHKNENERKVKTADELFQKTKTQPAIYFSPLTEDQITERTKQKNVAVDATVAKHNTQAPRDERHKEDAPEKDGKFRVSPWRRQRSPIAQKKRRASRSRSPRKP